MSGIVAHEPVETLHGRGEAACRVNRGSQDADDAPRSRCVLPQMTQRLLGTLLLVIALGAGLIFANLDDRLLWDDEAETALLAQRVLSHGVPTAWDGRDLISQRCGTDYDGNYLWRESPWAQVYLTAGSFKLFGIGT